MSQKESVDEKITWKVIDTFFRDNPNYLVKHQISSYDEFFETGFANIIKEKNPIRIMKYQDPTTNEYRLKANLYIGGRNGDKIYYGKPVIYDNNDNVQYMYPNKARLRNMTYGFSIHMDIDVEFEIHSDEDDSVKINTHTIEKVFFGRFPIMLQSKLCILNKLAPETRFNMGECRNDYGGYFIIDGKEKVIVSQEKFADNMLYIRDKVNDLYSHSAEIRTVSEDASKPERTLSVRIGSDSPFLKNGQIVVNVPNVRKPIPLFILMRALGVISDKRIIEYCLLDINENKSMLELFRPSIYDALAVFDQSSALKYIATFTKGKTIPHVMDILYNYFMPNVGTVELNKKAYMLGYIVNKLLKVYTKLEKPTDRDSFRYKRIEVAGSLLYSLFKEFYTIQQKNIKDLIDNRYYYSNEGIYQKDFKSLITTNHYDFFKDRILETGIRKGFKGNWGGQSHTYREGIVQSLDRLSYNKFISLLRKVNLQIDSSAKIVGPRLLNSTQWGIIDPLDTPDGGNIGTHKHLALATHITGSCSGKPIQEWFKQQGMILLEECRPDYISNNTKILINGSFCGVITNPKEVVDRFIVLRRNGVIPIFTSIQWSIAGKEIFIATDAGRPTRPIFYVKDGKISYELPHVYEFIKAGEYTWKDLLVGSSNKSLTLSECGVNNDSKINDKTGGIIDYIDTAEAEEILLAIKNQEFTKTNYTHAEIHPSLCLGVMGNQIVFPEHNQLPRNMFSCVQGRQAVSLYNSNFLNRMDKMGVVLNYGETPLVKSRYENYINKEQHPYGLNTIVAIMSYTGYNVEDAVLVNEGSLNRGLFSTTYYTTYEDFEEVESVGGSSVNTEFANIEETENVIGLKMGYDYSKLNENGLAKEETQVNDKTILIGKVEKSVSTPNTYLDDSYGPKKGQLGYVDKAFITQGETGYRIAKVRIREERIPAIGDKICSRAGQKGTIGTILPEGDIPFTADGLKPDLIINPHALPSRMTIGQLVESLMGKACALYGGWGDCTAFVNKGSTHQIFGNMLVKEGYHRSGNDVMYNGITGEQLQGEIFIGPTYYLRLKHMVKDKINYRSRGPRTLLTRQTVHGRANDGGLRIGEMERDGLIAHGMSGFLEESMMVRGDEYYLAVCNTTGTIAIYNEERNLFLSPMADGPLKFTSSTDNEINISNISRFGRTFSIVRVPYTFKLLMHELATMNVQMRIITEDNADQIMNLNFPSQNINTMELNKITQYVKRRLQGTTTDSLDEEDNDEEGNVPQLGERVEGVEGVDGDEGEDGSLINIDTATPMTGGDIGIDDDDEMLEEETYDDDMVKVNKIINTINESKDNDIEDLQDTEVTDEINNPMENPERNQEGTQEGNQEAKEEEKPTIYNPTPLEKVTPELDILGVKKDEENDAETDKPDEANGQNEEKKIIL